MKKSSDVEVAAFIRKLREVNATPNAKLKTKKRPSLFWPALLIGLILIGHAVGTQTNDTPSTEQPAKLDNNPALSLIACNQAQEAVEAELKGDATAEFPSCAWSMSEYEILGNADKTAISVSGHMDVEKKAGAKSRSNFVVLLAKQPIYLVTSGWSVKGVAIH